MYKSNPAENPDLIQDVTRFHQKFNIPRRQIGQPLDIDLARFRVRFLAEELREANIASAEGNLPDLLDALVDIVYVAIGTANVLNLDFQEAWRAVHHANMQKVNRSEEHPGKRGHSSDIVKPHGWVAPSHTELFTDEDLEQPPLTLNPEKGLVDLAAFMSA